MPPRPERVPEMNQRHVDMPELVDLLSGDVAGVSVFDRRLAIGHSVSEMDLTSLLIEDTCRRLGLSDDPTLKRFAAVIGRGSIRRVFDAESLVVRFGDRLSPTHILDIRLRSEEPEVRHVIAVNQDLTGEQ